MQKSVYSLVLMDDVVAAVDRLAYAAGTSRSNMINRILAEYSSLDTPEQRIQDVFSVISAVIEQQSVLQPMLSASDAMLSLRSALQYKYNPSVRYVVELYPHIDAEMGEMRAGLRTQNPTLLLYLSQFFRLWTKLEANYLSDPPRTYNAESGRFTRVFLTPQNGFSADSAGQAIADYIALFDTCLKNYFDYLNDAPAAVRTTEQLYRQNLDAATAQL